MSSGSSAPYSPASQNADLPTSDEQRPLPPVPSASGRSRPLSIPAHSSQLLQPPMTRPPPLRLPDLPHSTEAAGIPPALPSPEPRASQFRPTTVQPLNDAEAVSAPHLSTPSAPLMTDRSRSSPEHPTAPSDRPTDLRRARMSWAHLDAPSFAEPEPDVPPSGPPPSYHEAIRAPWERQEAIPRERFSRRHARSPLSSAVNQATALSDTVQRLASLSTTEAEDSTRGSQADQAAISAEVPYAPSTSGTPVPRSSLSFTPHRAESVPGAFPLPREAPHRPSSPRAQPTQVDGHSRLPPLPPLVNVIDRFQRRTSQLSEQEQAALIMAVEANVFHTRLWAADKDRIKARCLNWESCPGCLEPIVRGQEAAAPLPNDRTGTREVTLSSCRHGAHTRCLISWMAQGYGTCPQCRQTWTPP